MARKKKREEDEAEEQVRGQKGLRYKKAVADDGEDDEDVEENGKDENKKDNFIVDEAEEEDEEEAYVTKKGKAKKEKHQKRQKKRLVLDEDDYVMLEEAGFHRPPRLDNNKKFKRLKKAGHITGGKGSGSIGLSDEEGGGVWQRHTAEEQLKRSLFGDDEGGAPDIREDEELEEEEEEETSEDDDEMADFIVDEEDVYELGSSSKRKKMKKKKKPFRQAQGIHSVARQEAQEIFGSGSSLHHKHMMKETAGLDTEKRDEENDEDEYGCAQQAPSQKILEKQFEPTLLEEKFLTERNDHLRKTDVPERLQILEEAVGAFPELETASGEAEWIFDHAFGPLAVPMHSEFQYLLKMDKAEIVKQIANVLLMVHDEKLELPFIGMYRREECLDLLGEPDINDMDDKPKIRYHEALWAVQHWDKKWLLLQGRKISLQAAYERRIPIDARDDPEKEDLVEKLLRALMDAPSEQAVDDVDAKFNLHFPPDEVEIVANGFKRPKRKSFYSICCKAGLASMAKHFGLSPDQFGENLLLMYKKHDVKDEAISPDELASRFCATAKETPGGFQEPQSVIKGARHMVAVEISTEPAVREYVRHIYTEKAVVSTKPTPEGNSAIDSYHAYAGVKWLLNKPISAFHGEQWLLIQKAEEEKQLEVTIGLPKDIIENSLMQEFESLYLSEGVSLTAQQWNEHRRQILQDALVSLILPSMEKEARMIMAARAKLWLAAECGLKLWKKVSMAPYVPPKMVDNEDRSDSVVVPRVLACCWGPGYPATTFVMLDSAGGVLNVLSTGYLNIRAASPEQEQRKMNDQNRLLKFMRDYQPHVVVLGAANVQCRYLYRDIVEDVMFKLVEQHPRDSAEGVDMIKVVYGDESIPSLYENSQVSQEQLPGQPGIVRRAVAVGRFFQNPIAMVASLCGSAKEVLSLHLHPMQSILNSEEVYEAIEYVMGMVTNQVGIDINLAASNDWLFAPLQFIAGLGPRKAGTIQRAIQSVGRLRTRKELYAGLRLMGMKVFINSAGFIRVCGSGQAASGTPTWDPLDNTRIHPESYLVAKNMAKAALKEEATRNEKDVDDDYLEKSVEHVIENPNVLSTVDIKEYAQGVQVRGQTQKFHTLALIKSELQHGFCEWRYKYADPNSDEEFYMLSGESEETLALGRIVQAKVRKVQEHRVMCVLPSGLLGFIQQEDLSDEQEVVPSDKMAEGRTVTCRIKDVNKEKYIVDLTCKDSDMKGDFWVNHQQRDPFYSEDKSFMRLQYEKARMKKDEEKKKAFKPRMIVHPQFQNFSLDDAIKALEDKDVGEVIIRPSIKGPTHLSMTLKISDSVYNNIDILEGGKESRDLTSFLSLGKTLTVDGETFEGLDEVITRYVVPVVSLLQAMIQYRKFKHGFKVEIDDTLRSEKAENPKRIPYYFSIAHEHPGAFMLSYIRRINPQHEYISISPKGFRFRKKNFESIDKLVTYFQEHFHDPVPEASPRGLLATPKFGYDNRNRWDHGGDSSTGRGGQGRSRGDRGRGRRRGRGRGQEYGYGNGRGSGRGKESWGSARSSQGGGWDNRDKDAETTTSGGPAWDKDAGTTSEWAAWEKDAGITTSGGAAWGKDEGTTSGGAAWGKDEGTTSGGAAWDKDKGTTSGGAAWGKDEGTTSGGAAWDRDEGTTSGGAAWDNDTGTKDSGGGGWEEVVAGGASSGGDNWDKLITTSNNTEVARSGWKSGTGAEWNKPVAPSSGGWEDGSGGSGHWGAGWNQGQDGGGGNQGDLDKGISQAQVKSNDNNWGQDVASSTHAHDGWNEVAANPVHDEDVGGNQRSSGRSGDYASEAQEQNPAAGDINRQSLKADTSSGDWGALSKVDTSGGDWGALEPAALVVSRDKNKLPAPGSSGGWNQDKGSERDWDSKVQPPASTGVDGWDKEAEEPPKKTGLSSGWDAPAESSEGAGWGAFSADGGGQDKASEGWDQLDSTPGGGRKQQGRGGQRGWERGSGRRGHGDQYGGNEWGRRTPPQPVPPSPGC